MDLSWIGSAAGGIGLFLLGVRLMTEGLRVAAGRALGRLLKRATASRWRALLTGFGLTAVVQSSSAVTVAAIGFVNAGLLELREALWVVFGSNVGTTTTGWLVSATGLRFDVAAYALPMIGLGALARALDRKRRLGAAGEALAGLGLFFLWITILGQALETLASALDLQQLGSGWTAQIGLFFAGAALTVMMQSSSAAIAITLSAALSGLVHLQGAGAMIVGANIGTTSTALLAVVGATPAARRAAAGHVVFNVLAAVVALALLPWLLGLIQMGIGAGREGPNGAHEVVTTLALFHTAFNVLGVLLIWPLAGRLEGTLARRWVTKEEERSRPRYLDRTVLSVPEVALEAILKEMRRLARHASEIVLLTLAPEQTDPDAVARQADAFEKLGLAVSGFVADLAAHHLAEPASRTLTRMIRARRHYDTAVEQARILVGLRAELAEEAPALAALVDPLADAMRSAAAAANPEADTFALSTCERELGRMNERFDRLRDELLAKAARGEASTRAVVLAQHFLAEGRRAVRHLVRAVESIEALRSGTEA